MIVNSLGTRCPQPIIDIANALKTNPGESEFHLLSDDPATWPDLQAWARMTNHRVAKDEASTTAEKPSYLIWR